MKKILISITFILAFFSPHSVGATDIDVTFEPDPLFNEDGYLPGDETTDRYATVSNGTNKSQDIFMGISDIAMTQDLAEVVMLRVLENRTEVWNGSLADLVTSGSVFLSSLGSLSDTRYDFFAYMKEDAGNKYQSARVEFDLWVGFDQESEEEPVSGGGVSGGGFLPTFLQILDEGVRNIISNNPGFDVTFGWLTNLPADSRLVYGPDNGNSYVLDLSASNLGYPLSTNTFNVVTPVTGHSLVVEGLLPGTYLYRVVSSDGSLTVSPEHRFVLAEDGSVTDGLVLGVSTVPEDAQIDTVSGIINKAKVLVEGVLGVSDDKETERGLLGEFDDVGEAKESGASAVLGGGEVSDEKSICWRIFWFVVLISTILTSVWDRWTRDIGRVSSRSLWTGRVLFMAILLVLSAITLVFVGEFCPVYKLGITAIILGLVALILKRR